MNTETKYWPASPKILARISHGGELIAIFKRPPSDEQGHAMAKALTGQSQLAALREELARKDVVIEDMLQSNSDMTTRLAAAEQRNASIVGKVMECKVCGSDDLFWFAQNTVPNGIQQNRLNTHDVKCVFVLGCNHCSETLKLVSADKIGEQMTAALKPTESGASE